VTTPPVAPLSAPLEISFDYTRSLGPVLTQFMAGLAQRQILGSRSAGGRVLVPPAEYDPVTFAPPAELVEVGPDGTVLTWSWQPEPREGQPLGHPFAWWHRGLAAAEPGQDHRLGHLGDSQLAPDPRCHRGEAGHPGHDLGVQAQLGAPVKLLLDGAP